MKIRKLLVMFCRLAITPAVCGCPKQNRKLNFMKTSILPLCLLAFLFTFPNQTFVAQANAATFTVTTTADSGAGSLRAAVNNSDLFSSENDVINFSAALSGQSIVLASEIQIRSVEGTLTINGLGANNLTIDGGPGTNRIFSINTAPVTITDLTLTGGGGTGNTGSSFGGAIYSVSSNLTLDRVHVTGNTAGNADGGVSARGETFQISNSTFSSNTAGTDCGAFSNRGTLTVVNSTISGNSAANSGGGFCNYGTATLRNVTITNNTAGPAGGGILTSGSLTLGNTIVAGNRDENFPEFFISSGGTFTSSGYNLIGDDPGDSTKTRVPVTYQPTDILDKKPLLGALTVANGGTTPTHALLAGSPAIEKGFSFGFTTDQRGFLRPFDNPFVVNAPGGDGADIGAFEVQQVTTAADYTVDTTVDDATLSACTAEVANDCSLRGAINNANASTTEADTIDFAIPTGAAGCTPGGVCTITLTGGELEINSAATAGALTITNQAGASNLLISGNNSSIVFYVLEGADLTLGGVTVTRGTGGILNQGTLTLTNSIVSGNRSVLGGGINNGNRGTATLFNSTVSGNTATFRGGGILNSSNSTVSLTNSTVSGNTALDGTGGGISNNSGTLNLTSVTVAFNRSSETGGGVYGDGASTTNLRNTIVAQNTAPSFPDFDSATAPTGSFNLIGSGTRTSGITNGTNGNQVGTSTKPIDPLLAPLANNGGTTPTHALSAGSPAIDQGFSFGFNTDQRGFLRPVDNPSIMNAPSGDGADIGAFEVQSTTAATVTVSGRVTARGRGILNAVVHLTSQSGEIQTAKTSRGGYYTFTDLEAGETYIFNVFSKRYQFDPKVINLTEDLIDIDFIDQ